MSLSCSLASACGGAWCAAAAEDSASAASFPSLSKRSGGPPDVDVCRMSFDPHEVEIVRGLQSQLRYKHGPQIRSALGIQLSLTLQESSSNTHDMLTARPDLEVSFMYTHRGDCRQKFRRVCGFRFPLPSSPAFFFLLAAFCTGMRNSHQGRKCGNPRNRSLFHHTLPHHEK